MLSVVRALLVNVPEPIDPTVPTVATATTAAPDTPPTTAAPSTPDPFVEPTGGESQSIAGTIADVLGAAFDNLLENGYQTGVAVLVAAAALITMRNLGIKGLVPFLVGIGAFWGGWVLYDLVTGGNNPLFATGVEAGDFLDVAFGGDQGFLVAAIAGAIAAWFLWRKEAKVWVRILLLIGALFSASFFYNLVEAVRFARS